MDGPSWLGIGAQRCGTTWFGDLLLQHPKVAFGRDGKKEVHFFDRYLVEPWTASARREYAALFDPAKCSGDFTPSYLRSLWVPGLARQACKPDVVLLVLLRDPVERFGSSMRWYATRPGVPVRDRRNEYLNWVRDKGNDAIWGGMYAEQLAAWSQVFPREQFIVLQYEAIRRDPQTAADRVWLALGLNPQPLRAAVEPTWNSTPNSGATDAWEHTPGLKERLRALYAPGVKTLAAKALPVAPGVSPSQSSSLRGSTLR